MVSMSIPPTFDAVFAVGYMKNPHVAGLGVAIDFM